MLCAQFYSWHWRISNYEHNEEEACILVQKADDNHENMINEQKSPQELAAMKDKEMVMW